MTEQIIQVKVRAISDKWLILEVPKTFDTPAKRIDITASNVKRILTFITGKKWDDVSSVLYTSFIYAYLPESILRHYAFIYESYTYTENQ